MGRSRRSVSRVLSSQRKAAAMDGHSSGAFVAVRLVATYPDSGAEIRLQICICMPSLFGLAPGGVYRAVDVAANAVRSYHTLSPLPHPKMRRFAFCGTFPRVAPAGCYPAPCFHGARTFLPPAGFPVAGRRPSNRLNQLHSRPKKNPGQLFIAATALINARVSRSASPVTD